MNKKLMMIFGAALLTGNMMSAQQINPLTQAMMSGYEEILKQDPKDYVTLYQRAAQYYALSQYDKAFLDVVKALQFTPEKERDMLAREYSLLADISIENKDYERALDSVNKALVLEPENYANIYKKGNICLYLNKPEDAYRAFSGLQRLKSRSQEAYFGMAKAAIMKGDINDAEDLIKQAEQADPSNYITYCRLGDLYRDMKANEKAATNYIVAYSLTDDSQRPVESLVSLAAEDFNSVNAALDYTISKTTSKVPLLYLKASLGNKAGKYSEARSALEKLTAMPEGRKGSVYAMFAEVNLAEDRTDDALVEIDKAINDEPRQEYYILKSEILLRQSKPTSALMEIEKACSGSTVSLEALMQKAKVLIGSKEYKKALELLNEVVMSDPENGKALLMRAYVNEEAGNSKQGVADFIRLGNIDASGFPEYTYKALGKAKSGKKLDGDTIIANAINADNSKEATYWGAVYYAQTGDLERAKELIDKSISAGYQNLYNLNSNVEPLENISPIRRLLKK